MILLLLLFTLKFVICMEAMAFFLQILAKAYSETSLQHFDFDRIHSATVAVLVTCVNYVHTLMHIIARIILLLQHLYMLVSYADHAVKRGKARCRLLHWNLYCWKELNMTCNEAERHRTGFITQS